MRVHQICARLQYGDAVTGQVIRLHRLFLSWGWESRVYASSRDRAMASIDEGLEAYRPFMKAREDLLLYHFSVYDDNYRLFLESANRKVLIYHNITPPEFLAPYDPHLAEVCRRGRELLPRLSDCDLALGDSEFNRRELVEAGFPEEKTGVLPIFVNLEELGSEYNRALAEKLKDGRDNLLFVGRMVPNKRVEDLIDLFAFYYHYVNAHSRLLLVGTSWSVAYNAELARRIRRYAVQGAVIIPGWSWGVSDEDLRAYYRSAHVFITCSLHEGFCVPLLESMFFGVPILAREAAAVPFTLGGAGMTFKDLDFPVLVEAVEEILRNEALRGRMVEKGRRRLEDFHPRRTERTLRDHLQSLLGSAFR
jgi:glycosyltransferase involved in cell wall biosynthesis